MLDASQAMTSTQDVTQVSRLSKTKSEALIDSKTSIVPYFEKYKSKPVQPSWGHQGAHTPLDKIVMNNEERNFELKQIIRDIAQGRERFEVVELSREYEEAHDIGGESENS